MARNIIVIICTFLYVNVFGNIFDENESLLNSAPPLYALDVWHDCQKAGDVYCIVDAVLISNGSSPLLEFLQEYSQQTLKHYNRTLIHRGVCVTSCNEDDMENESDRSWSESAQICLNASLVKYGLEANILSVDWCTRTGVPPAQVGSGPAKALAVLCTVLAALAFLATGLHVLGQKCAVSEGNKYLLAFSIVRNWKILTYDRSKPRTDERMRDVACIEAIRFLGMQCVIFSHVLLIYVYSYVDNPEFVEKMYDQFGWRAVLNSPLWLQAFFSISGFLTAYATLLTYERNPITLYKCIMSVMHRWIRLTPMAVFALWFTIAWFPLLGSGPQWAWLVEREAQDCAERWWYHVLYVHNHLPLGKFCMGHTWYLAADMQLHIFGVFLLLVLLRYRCAAVPVLPTLIIGSALASGFVVYFYNLMPIITAQSPEILRNMFAGSKILPLVYLPFWMNLPGYVGGMATAFILHYNQNKGATKLNECKWFNILFHLSLILGGCVVVSGVIFLSDSPPPLWASALYAGIDRTLVAIFFNIFMLGCFSRCKSILRDIFEWRGFHILGRLSYCVFLMHFIILRLTLAGNTQLGHASILSLISLLITSSVLTYLISIPLCLLVELPALQLWKALTDRDIRTPRANQNTIPQHVIKPLDLLAHIRRRHDI
ncbi:hypothetical protein K1T71_010501 [Dendrolimus kikuchii]|uniref:Uncharacterized protein n=1 Tax=Dendrolimus kikuchii TaxID=765133 RepID=A0ACC1CS53_9NEOP|nr:hypothetical protein K1T71_010501 [Dendrolimus kikuchii]